MRYLFLDIDGVLNCHEYDGEAQSLSINKHNLYWLNNIIRVYEPKIIISSAWRYLMIKKAMGVEGFKYMLRTHGLVANADIIGYTREDSFKVNYLDGPNGFQVGVEERKQQIIDWVTEPVNQFKGKFAVLDDLPVFDNKEIKFNNITGLFVQTDSKVGLTKVEYKEIYDYYK